MIDRRLTPRWEINSPVAVHFREENFSDACCLEDLNLKGMRLSFPNKLPEKDCFRLELSLMNGFHLPVTVHVRWKEEFPGHYIYGMEFTSVRDHDRDGIYQYLHEKVGSKWEEHWWAIKEY